MSARNSKNDVESETDSELLNFKSIVEPQLLSFIMTILRFIWCSLAQTRRRDLTQTSDLAQPDSEDIYRRERSQLEDVLVLQLPLSAQS